MSTSYRFVRLNPKPGRSAAGRAGGPVLHLDDVVAGKMSALFTGAEPRDFSASVRGNSSI